MLLKLIKLSYNYIISILNSIFCMKNNNNSSSNNNNNNNQIKIKTKIIKSLLKEYHFINFLIHIISKVVSIRYNKISKIINNISNIRNKYNNKKSFKYKSKIKYIYYKYKNNNIFAFSLIELSIVLIIIGLLVAGITGGASLIESAKMRNFINEVNSWKQALYTFKVRYDRLPGDLNNDGFLGGWCGGGTCPNGDKNSGEVYTKNSFPSPYNNKAQKSDAGAYIELYLEGITNWEPDPENFARPLLKIIPDLTWTFHQFSNFTKQNYWLTGAKTNTTWMVSNSDLAYKNSYNNIVDKVDKKMDDGICNSGNVRCTHADFKEGNRLAVFLIGE